MEQHMLYVFSMDGASCTVTTVEPLVVLYSALLVSMLARSTLGRRKPFSDGEGMDGWMKLPETELGANVLMRMFCVVAEDFLRGLEPPTPASILDACVRL